ncbi:mycothiol system anti-sigma-R factor [Corynebacterium sp. UBA2622]|uniref:mycothiol system anti-sigma-R factor n=1 Tax=Corynebacterium sp. UBA2622 TaxID=1946393 RepID=UPI0025C43B05|nr:mycothiol system anti-sigma-R factor [Corynebacterium sp. UBA2622]
MGAGHEHSSTCREATTLLCELLDGDTTPERAAEIRERLAACPECFSHLQSELAVRGLVRDCCGKVHAPEPLRERIITSITTVSVTRYRI